MNALVLHGRSAVLKPALCPCPRPPWTGCGDPPLSPTHWCNRAAMSQPLGRSERDLGAWGMAALCPGGDTGKTRGRSPERTSLKGWPPGPREAPQPPLQGASSGTHRAEACRSPRWRKLPGGPAELAPRECGRRDPLPCFSPVPSRLQMPQPGRWAPQSVRWGRSLSPPCAAVGSERTRAPSRGDLPLCRRVSSGDEVVSVCHLTDATLDSARGRDLRICWPRCTCKTGPPTPQRGVRLEREWAELFWERQMVCILGFAARGSVSSSSSPPPPLSLTAFRNR